MAANDNDDAELSHYFVLSKVLQTNLESRFDLQSFNSCELIGQGSQAEWILQPAQCVGFDGGEADADLQPCEQLTESRSGPSHL